MILIKKVVLAFIFFFILVPVVFARSGCCSHHDGVKADGCGCNDGTPLSSTCAPYYTCTSSSNNYVPVQQTQQIVYPTSTSAYVKPTNTPIPPTDTPIPTSTTKPTTTSKSTITTKPTQAFTPTAAVKPTEKPTPTTPTPTPKESFWRQLIRFLFNF
jgi:hypothetical protein